MTHLVVTELVQSPGSLVEQEQENTFLHSLAERKLAQKVPSDTMQLLVTLHYCEPLQAECSYKPASARRKKAINNCWMWSPWMQKQTQPEDSSHKPSGLRYHWFDHLQRHIWAERIPRIPCILFKTKHHPKHRETIHIAYRGLQGYDYC